LFLSEYLSNISSSVSDTVRNGFGSRKLHLLIAIRFSRP
jgi:hypothetical protein